MTILRQKMFTENFFNLLLDLESGWEIKTGSTN